MDHGAPNVMAERVVERGCSNRHGRRQDASEEEDNESEPLLPKSSKEDNESEPLLPKSPKFIKSLPCSEYWHDLCTHFGYKLLAFLFVAQHLIKGFVMSFAGALEPYVYRSYSVPAPTMQILGGVTSLPWALKPVIGLASDIFPIRGYNKAPYLVSTAVIGTLAHAAIGGMPKSVFPVSALVIALFTVSLQESTCDLLSEAKYAEKMRAKPAQGPAILTYVWFGLQFGGLVAVALSGPAINVLGAKLCFWITAVPVACVVLVVSWGYCEEQKQTAEQVAEARARFARQKEACGLCFVILLASACLMVSGLAFQSPVVNGVMAIVVFVLVLTSFSLVLAPVIAKFNAFTLIQTSLSWNVAGAAYFFYTDTEKQYPEGPHFSPFFYNSVLGITSAVLSLVGIVTYNRYLSAWSYRSLLLVSNVALAVFSTLDVILFSRLNKRIGINDHVFVLGSSVMTEIISQWQWMPQVVILPNLCPKGMEATMFALLAGCHNLGNSIAANGGAWLLHSWGVSPNGDDNESHQFENLWKATSVGIVLPVITIFLLFHLIPTQSQCESLIDGHEEASATRGSLLNMWMERGGR